MSPHPLARRFSYDAWANHQSLRSLQAQSGAVPDRAVAILAHVVAAERLWIGRLGADLPSGDAAHAIWPSSTLDESAEALAGLARSWPAILGRFVPDRLDHAVTYTNTQGQTHTSLAGDILEHVLLHGAYHRGQIATLLGRAGLPSTSTDFIHWARSGEPGP